MPVQLVERMAFEIPADDAGFSVRAFYLQQHVGLVELLHNGRLIWNSYPDAYRVWNYAAHADDLISEGHRIVGLEPSA